MPTPFKAGCQRPPGVLPEQVVGTKGEEPKKEAVQKMIKVGAPAPDFELPGYLNHSFSNFRLSEYKGKWVLLCFYPGDFTFV